MHDPRSVKLPEAADAEGIDGFLERLPFARCRVVRLADYPCAPSATSRRCWRAAWILERAREAGVAGA
jgi:hypothetical protein